MSEKSSPRRPRQLRKADRANFETIVKAAAAGDLAIVSAVRKSDGKDVALVCAMGYDGDNYYPVPLAVMVEGNPFDLFFDPTEV